MSELAPFLLTLCQLAFAIGEPPPEEAVAMLRRAYGCPAEVRVNIDGMPALPLGQAGSWFPAPPRFWPVLDGAGADEAAVDDWTESGVRPGLLLPEDPVTLALRFDEAERLRRAVARGAIPVLPIRRPLGGSVTYGATVYAALGLAPQAVYVVDGFGLDLGLLPGGRHLVAAHWRAPYDWMPLPARRISQGSSTFLAVFDGPSPGGGLYASLGEGRGAAFTPALGLRWSFLGADFETGAAGLDTGWGGKAVLMLVRVSSIVWAGVTGNWPDLLTGLVALLAWIGIVVAALLFLVLPVGLAFSRWRHGRA